MSVYTIIMELISENLSFLIFLFFFIEINSFSSSHLPVILMALPMSPKQIFIVFLIIIFLVIIVVVVVFQRVVLGVSFLVFGIIIAKAPQCFFHSKKLSAISERESRQFRYDRVQSTLLMVID